MNLLTRRAAAAGLLSLPAIRKSHAHEPIRMRCSLDTAPAHGRNVNIAAFLKTVETESQGRIKTELFESGQLYADLNVLKALMQGDVDMCAPGAWAITGFVPEGDIFQLPAMYDQPIEVIHRVADGQAGKLVAAIAEKKLRCHLLGRWLDNGFSNWFTVKVPLRTFDDLKGLKIRNSGGVGQSWRTKFFDAIPTVTTWPAVPLGLSQGMFDGLIAANDSVQSAKLFDTGLRFSLQDHNFFGAYLPMLSHAFWEKLPPALQKLVVDLWEANIAAYRDRMASGQAKARTTLEGLGMTFVDVPADRASAVRTEMLKQQEAVAKEMRIAPDVVTAVMKDIG